MACPKQILVDLMYYLFDYTGELKETVFAPDPPNYD